MPVRQGDILCTRAFDEQGNDGLARKWGVIVTADCDIAQGKMGGLFTYLTIVTAQEYLEHIWATDQIAALNRRWGQKAIDIIHAADRKRDRKVKPLRLLQLLNWIREDGSAAVLESVSIEGTKSRSSAKTLDLFALSSDSHEYTTPLEQLRACWDLDGRKLKEQSGTIKSALHQRYMRSDCILIPALPAEDEVGFVILLRDIRSVSPCELHLSQLRMKVSGGTSGIYRIGRFSDFIRHSIAQRLAILFSRIGMTPEFEDECVSAGELVAEHISNALLIREKLSDAK